MKSIFTNGLAIALTLMVLGLISCKESSETLTLITTPYSGAKIAAETAPSVTLPTWGNYSTTTDNAIKWYNKSGSWAHKDWTSFDDTNAYDLNLSGDLDANLPVLSPFAGTISSLGSTYPGTLTGGTYGAVLINIDNKNYIGLMHLKNIKLKSGDKVTAGQQVGTVGNIGVDNNHLHMAYYTKNAKGIYVSKAVNFVDRSFTLSLSWKDAKNTTSKVGGTNQLTTTVPFGIGDAKAGAIESVTYYNNTFWTSTDPKICTVDGYGKLKGIKSGSTTIRLKFSGQEFTFPVTVK